MKDSRIENLKRELKEKILKLSEEENKITVEYKGYTGVYYRDSLNYFEEQFDNMEIWKDDKLKLHATLSKALTKEELYDRLKSYVEKKEISKEV